MKQIVVVLLSATLMLGCSVLKGNKSAEVVGADTTAVASDTVVQIAQTVETQPTQHSFFLFLQ